MGVPGNASPLLLTSAAGAAGGYEISRSVRFSSSDSAFLSRTPGTAGNRKTWTWAGWVKRGLLNGSTTYQQLFSAGTGNPPRDVFFFDTDVDDTLCFFSAGGLFPTNTLIFRTNAVFRDTSAWYHVTLTVDTTQATTSNRVKLYVNGVLQTFSTANYPTQNSDSLINNNTDHAIGRDEGQDVQYFDGYLADIHFIDGQALTPSSFGEFDTNNVWQPKAFSGGSYGTNGFRLPFSDNSTAAALGTDTSGNGNTWTVNNLSVTAGAGNDSLVDSPTNGSQVDTGVGGEVVGNYCTANPLDNGGYTLANGNLDVSTTSASWKTVKSTIGVSSGKWYWEFSSTDAALGGSPYRAVDLGIAKSAATLGNYVGSDASGWCYQNYDGNKFNNGSGSSYGATWIAGDVIGVALDADNGTLVFYKNGVSQGTAFTGLTSGPYFPAVSLYTGSSVSGSFNFGQRLFAYTAPSGFKALCTTNLPTPTIADGSTVMDVKLYTGNGSTQTISGLNFSPDLVWIKQRSAVRSNWLTDTVRGNTKLLSSDQTAAEITETDCITAFNSDGFSLDADAGFNASAGTYVAWTWDAGSSTVTNTAGSISSQVRANASAGFSIVTYTGNASNATVGHGLGVAPSLYIVKARTSSGFTDFWSVYHRSLGATAYIKLNSTDAQTTGSTIWNSTAPTSTVFSVVSASIANENGVTYVAYCFAPVVGHSAMGSFTSGSSPFVFTGFKPRFILAKGTGSGRIWNIYDSARDPYNAAGKILKAEDSGAEIDSPPRVDFLSNGFKVRSSSGAEPNVSDTYIYYAVAEHPFQHARAR